VIPSIATIVAAFYALCSLAFAALFAANLRIPDGRPAASPTLILPVTGELPRLEDLLTALAAQSLRPRRLIIVVESRDDPAYARVASLAKLRVEPDIELVVAGLSPLRGQKCTNILAALKHLDDDDAYIVLLDADITPQPWWLAALVAPLAAGSADIVNGYRWQAPRLAGVGTALVAAIDRAIAVLPRLSLARTIWGGSLALSRYALEALELPATIGRAVTEDLPIGDRAADSGLRVLTRRAIKVPTPLGGSLWDLWRFGRRQYQLIRLYRPGLWFYAVFITTTDFAARTALLFIAVTSGGSRSVLAVILALAALGSIATEMRCGIGKHLGAPDRGGVRLWQHLLAWMILPIPGFHATVIWASFVTSPLRWAHICYIVDREGQVTDLSRGPYSDRLT
jgi:cellulose synthase/poly-beta-1,6-N-acetylglucosamine synthase-like glycosyltransferase